MSKMVFSVPLYRAVKNTEIVNEGITVLAGINGSGKSSLARMIYYAVNFMAQFPTLVFNNRKKEVLDVVRSLVMAVHQINHGSDFFVTMREQEEKISNSKDFTDIAANFDSLARYVEPFLTAFFSKSDKNKVDRILGYLEVSNDGDASELAAKCISSIKDKVNLLLEAGNKDVASRKKKLLLNLIRSLGVDMGDFPDDFNLTEDGVPLIKSPGFVNPLSLKRAIYIDTPMAVNENFNLSVNYWDRLTSLMNQDAVAEYTKPERGLLLRIRHIIRGEVAYNEDLFGEKALHYKREDGLDIKLVNAATGFKSFAILYKLLANGLLKTDTMLLIDEPEAHLHPQWVVEYANILVKLNKELGVKIVVTSHNPDMISALSSIVASEGLEETTHFYLAKPCEGDSYHFKFDDLGVNIGPIFESFNIALSRIEQYGKGGSLSR